MCEPGPCFVPRSGHNTDPHLAALRSSAMFMFIFSVNSKHRHRHPPPDTNNSWLLAPGAAQQSSH